MPAVNINIKSFHTLHICTDIAWLEKVKLRSSQCISDAKIPTLGSYCYILNWNLSGFPISLATDVLEWSVLCIEPLHRTSTEPLQEKILGRLRNHGTRSTSMLCFPISYLILYEKQKITVVWEVYFLRSASNITERGFDVPIPSRPLDLIIFVLEI